VIARRTHAFRREDRLDGQKAFLGHRLEPSKRGRRRDCCSNTQAGHRHAQLRDLGLEEVEKHVPGWIREQVSVEEAITKASGADHGAHHVRSHWGRIRVLHSRRRGFQPLRLGGKPGESRCDAADFIAQLTQSLRALVRGHVAKRFDPICARHRDRQGRDPFGFRTIDHDLDSVSGRFREHQVDQIPGRRDDRGARAPGDVGADLFQQVVHHRSAIALKLDPQH